MFRVMALFLFGFTFAHGHEWHSQQGSRTLAGDFVKLAGEQVTVRTAAGQMVAIPLRQLTLQDQSYAQLSQATLEESVKLGPKSIEIHQLIPGGCICRMAARLSNGAVLYTGEQFLLLLDTSAPVQPGTRLKEQALYPAGQRLFHPAQGTEVSLRAFALVLDQAVSASIEVAAGRQPTDVHEPIVDSSIATGLGWALADEDHVLVDSALLADAKSIEVDLGRTHSLAQALARDERLGVTVLQCKGAMTAPRLAPRHALELGLPVYALTFTLNDRKTGVAAPTLTKGIVSKLTGPNGEEHGFEHDALIAPNALGGLVLSEKGDVLGLIRSQAAIKKSKGSRAAPDAPAPSPPTLGACLRTEDLMPFLKSVPKATAGRVNLSSDLQESAKALQKSVVLVKVTRETLREVTAAPKGPAFAPPPTINDPAAAWSLSKAGIRHNAKCRYFNARFPCQGGEGTPCKVCGG